MFSHFLPSRLVKHPRVRTWVKYSCTDWKCNPTPALGYATSYYEIVREVEVIKVSARIVRALY
jgi:hypothetical protein